MRALVLGITVLLGAGPALLSGNPTPLIRGQFELTDARTGQQVTQKSYEGSYRLVFFGFIHCPLTCPVGLHTVETVLARLGKDSARVKALFITIDPVRDSAKDMAAYLAGFDPRISGLVGSSMAITAAMRNFRLEAERMGKGDKYLLEHPAIIYLMGRHGEYLTTLPSSGDPAAIAKEVSKAMNKSIQQDSL
jgi:protein SCO1/2